MTLRLGAAVLAGSLAAGAAGAGEDAAAAKREIRIGPNPGSTGRLVVCAEPRPAAGAALAHALRWGLFEVCEGYRSGAVSADAYRAALEGYPALVLQTAALDALESAAQPPQRQLEAIRRQIAGNPTVGLLPDGGRRRARPYRLSGASAPLALPVGSLHRLHRMAPAYCPADKVPAGS